MSANGRSALVVGILTAIAAVMFAHVEERFDKQDEKVLGLVERLAEVSEKLSEKIVEVDREMRDRTADRYTGAEAKTFEREVRSSLREIRAEIAEFRLEVERRNRREGG